MRTREMAWRGVASMVIFLGWVIFITLFALLWAPSLDLFQNIVILIASIVGACLLVGMVWMAYGLRYGWEPSGEKWKEHIGAAVEEAIKEKVKEKLEELDTERE